MSASRNILIGLESVSPELTEELRPLWQRCWDECSEIKGETCAFHGERGFVIEPDVEQYLKLADQNSLLVVTLRNEGQLHGYGIGILYRSLHHKPIVVGNVDSFYIDPEYRLGVWSLIQKLETEFKAIGVTIIGWPTSVGGSLYPVLKALGYVADDVVMEKTLCALPPR